MSQRIALVGHCEVDGPRLKRDISAGLPGTEVVRINTMGDLERTLEEGVDLLLVNREPVGFEEEGVELIREVLEAHPAAKVMLVSNKAEAQEEAVKAGAMEGFGKKLMGTPELLVAVERGLGG
jgi:hypothetical protein